MDWSKPKEVSGIDLAFPSDVIGKFLPKKEDIPKEFWNRNHKTNASTWFYGGVDIEKSTMVFKDNIQEKDHIKALKQLQVCLGSYQPSQEHKIAGVDYLMSLFFDDLVLVGVE